MKTIKSFFAQFLIFVFVAFIPLHAQEKNETLYWFNGGFGWSALGSLAFNTSVTLQPKDIIYTFQITGHYYSDSWLFPSKRKEFYDYGILVGFTNKSDIYHTSISGGLVFVTGNRSTSTGGLFKKRKTINNNITPTLGIEVCSQLYWKAGKVFGLGLSLFADLNPEEFLGGITFSIFLGKLY